MPYVPTKNDLSLKNKMIFVFKIYWPFTLCLMTLCLFRVCVADEAAIESLQSYLSDSQNDISKVAGQPFATQPLTRAESAQASKILIGAWKKNLAREREAELEGTVLKIGDHEMKLFMREFGEKPEAGWSLYISMGDVPVIVKTDSGLTSVNVSNLN